MYIVRKIKKFHPQQTINIYKSGCLDKIYYGFLRILKNIIYFRSETDILTFYLIANLNSHEVLTSYLYNVGSANKKIKLSHLNF